MLVSLFLHVWEELYFHEHKPCLIITVFLRQLLKLEIMDMCSSTAMIALIRKHGMELSVAELQFHNITPILQLMSVCKKYH